MLVAFTKDREVTQALASAGARIEDGELSLAFAAALVLFKDGSNQLFQDLKESDDEEEVQASPDAEGTGADDTVDETTIESLAQDRNIPMYRVVLGAFYCDRIYDDTLVYLELLVFLGLTWDAACDEWLKLHEKAVLNRRPGIRSPDRFSRLPIDAAKTLRLCIQHWCAEHSKGLSLTQIPYEHVRNGLEATQTYLDQLTTSTDVVLRRKIVIVGPSGWGKTSLVNSLITGKPSLELPENRTMGIVKSELSFVEELATLRATWRHEVKFWDFAGHDEYQVSHALFFSRRTLYLVCIDLAEYAATFYKAEMITGDSMAFDERMNAFVETRILRWMRLILAREPAAEFKLVATKNDVLYSVDSDALADLQARLANVLVIVRGMQQVHRQVVRDARRAVDRQEQPRASPNRCEITHLDDERLEGMEIKPYVDLLVVDCMREESVVGAKHAIISMICRSQQSYPMPDNYSSVLRIIEEKREVAKAAGPRKRIADCFVKVETLVDELVASVGGIDRSTCRTILRALRDIGDVLWYEDFGDAFLRERVVIDPMLLIDLIREIFNHNQKNEVMYHADLAELPLWKAIEGDRDLMLTMKRLFQHFHLAYPADEKVMHWSSDLLLPASWRSKTSGQLLFMGQPLKAPYACPPIDWDVTVHWELAIVSGFEEAQFNHLVVATYTALVPRKVGPDFILYGDPTETSACRLFVDWNRKTHKRVLHLEAVLRASECPGKAKALWTFFQSICVGLASVFVAFPGLRVSISVRNGDERPQLRTCRNPHPTCSPPEPWLRDCRRLLLTPVASQ